MMETYNYCIHYFGGYCELSENDFGINTTCCERNECPSIKFSEETKNCIQSPHQHTRRKKGKN